MQILIKGAALLIAVLLVFSLIPNERVQASGSYSTESYSVAVDVTEQKKYMISEEIRVDSSEECQQIVRYIPVCGQLGYCEEGMQREAAYKARISNIRVNDKYSAKRSWDNYILQIGDEDFSIKGNHSYEIHYDYQMYTDDDKNKDLFYLNVIPSNWETSIQETDIIVTLPKQFDESKLEVYAGGYGSVDNGKVKYEVYGNKIHIMTTKLAAYEGVIVFLPLPEGYYKNIPDDFGWHLLASILTVIGMLGLLVVWFLYGRDYKEVEVAGFYPPENMDPLQIGYVVDGNLEKKDMMSLILYFAQKGYLSISEEKKRLTKKFILKKKCDSLPESCPDYQRTLFKGLFLYGDTVKLSRLDENFISHYQEAKRQLYNSFKCNERSMIFEANRGKLLLFLLNVVVFALVGMINGCLYGDLSDALLYLFPLAIMYGTGSGVRVNTSKKRVSSVGWKVLRGIFVGIAMLITAWFTYSIAYSHIGSVVPALLLAVQSIVYSFTFGYMGRRTPYGAELQGKILGFRKFLLKAEQDCIEGLVRENPTYFYDILPYALALGVTRKWAKHFKQIPITQPIWYRSSKLESFEVGAFASSINQCNSFFAQSVESAAYYSPGGFNTFESW